MKNKESSFVFTEISLVKEMEKVRPNIEILSGDITKVKVDAVVNAANASLMGGGGVDGAIHQAGGPIIMEECQQIVEQYGNCQTGNAVITSGGNLPAKYVIHTVGPVWKNGKNDESELLAKCYKNALQLAVENKCKSVAFPNISTGVYGFPKKMAAKIAVRNVVEFLNDHYEIEKLIFVCFDAENETFIRKELLKLKQF